MSSKLVRTVMTAWQWLHFRFGLPRPLLEPLAVERLCLDNYFSTDKARRDLGYTSLFTTQHAMRECLSYYSDMFAAMKSGATPAPAPA